MPVQNPRGLLENRATAIADYHETLALPRAELDVSGGVDSAVMLGLLAWALGPKNVTGVYSSIHSSDESRARAKLAAEAFGVRLVELELEAAFDAACEEVVRALDQAGVPRESTESKLAKDPMLAGSFRSCLRAPVGRFVNRLMGAGIRHGTGNECEDRWIRFYQKGGDGEVDTNPIDMLAKGEVLQLGVALGVPQEILRAVPTPDLWGVGATHNDEDELAALTGVQWTYSRIDPQSGKYTRVGTIERMSRSLDLRRESDSDGGTLGDFLFGPKFDAVRLPELVALCQPLFAGFSPAQIDEFLRSARALERSSRHKHNPNCPSLGERQSLVSAGLLSDQLPEPTSPLS